VTATCPALSQLRPVTCRMLKQWRAVRLAMSHTAGDSDSCAPNTWRRVHFISALTRHCQWRVYFHFCWLIRYNITYKATLFSHTNKIFYSVYFLLFFLCFIFLLLPLLLQTSVLILGTSPFPPCEARCLTRVCRTAFLFNTYLNDNGKMSTFVSN
jgi:hypothetical protein